MFDLFLLILGVMEGGDELTATGNDILGLDIVVWRSLLIRR
jgi:hypothetical protein